MRINPYSKNPVGGFPQAITDTPKAETGSFASELQAGINQVNQLQNQSETAMMDSSVKGASGIHETMIKIEEADISLRLLTKVRSKALDAYHEIMRMQF